MKISTILDHIDSGHMALPEFPRPEHPARQVAADAARRDSVQFAMCRERAHRWEFERNYRLMAPLDRSAISRSGATHADAYRFYVDQSVGAS